MMVVSEFIGLMIALQSIVPVSFSEHLGLHVNTTANGVQTMKDLQVSWVRLHEEISLKWSAVEPEEGVWIFPDSSINLLLDNQLRVVVSLGLTPAWASSYPNAVAYPHASIYFGPAAHVPRDWQDWELYVRAVIGRYSPRIAHWEVLNEPDIHFMVSPKVSKADLYQEYLNHSASIIRAADKANRVLAPSVAYALFPDTSTDVERFRLPIGRPRDYRDPDFLQEWLKKSSEYDVFSFHHYSIGKRSILQLAREGKLKKRIESLRFEAGRRPLWITEYNVLEPLDENQNIPEDIRIARQIVIEHLLLIKEGVEKIFMYSAVSQMARRDRFHNFFDAKGRETAIYRQYGLMSKTLGNKILVDWKKRPGNVIEAVFAGSEVISVFFSLQEAPVETPVIESDWIIDEEGRQFQLVPGTSLRLEPFSYLYVILGKGSNVR